MANPPHMSTYQVRWVVVVCKWEEDQSLLRGYGAKGMRHASKRFDKTCTTPLHDAVQHLCCVMLAREAFDSIRGQNSPKATAIEAAAFLEDWIIFRKDHRLWIDGFVWRLPLRMTKLSAPLIAIDGNAKWAKTDGEWLVLGLPLLFVRL